MKVGDIEVRTSDIYGNYNMTCVAIVDILLTDADTYGDWSDNGYHPVKYFGTVVIQKITEGSWYVLVPLRSHNLNWVKENPDCKYMQQVPRAKYFPCDQTDKSYYRWIKHSGPVLEEYYKIKEL